ncbi:hypothetical protein MQG33_004944 [Escherichia coli]|nr:hypothetical protein [Escherichia coli]
MSDYPGGDTPLSQQNKNKFPPDNLRHQHTSDHVESERICGYPQRKSEYRINATAIATPTAVNASGQFIGEPPAAAPVAASSGLLSMQVLPHRQ